MQNYKKYFKNKKITVMGLGLLGRGIGLTKFLAECGADLIVTDLKTKKQLASSIKALKNFSSPKQGFGRIKFVMGKHRLEDFQNRDMIIKSAGVPLDSIYIKKAKENGIPVEMDVSLFAKCVPEVMIIGVTGTRGKSMTTVLIHKILSENIKNRQIFLGGNLRGVATLPLLKKVNPPSAHFSRGGGDILVCELDSWQLQGFGEAKISPHISVFTTFMPDHMNYYKNNMKKYFNDKANIFKYQKKGDILIIRPEMKKFLLLLRGGSGRGWAKLIIAKKEQVKDWRFSVPGAHHQENLACAVEVAKQLGIPMEKIKKSVVSFKGLEGRLQLLRTYKGIKIYNDNNATTPEATITSLEALKNLQVLPVTYRQDLYKYKYKNRKIILICGGADKNLPLDNFIKAVNKYCQAVIFLPGSGTDKLKAHNPQRITYNMTEVKDLKKAIKNSLGLASRGDIILFSPAFASFGMFNNEYERNDLFVKIIKNLN